MNSLIEEGIVTLSTYASHKSFQIPVRCGVITAITPDALEDQRHNWGRIGFLSRVIPFSYSYGILTVKKIFDSILGLHYLDEKLITLKAPKKDKEVKLPLKYAQEIVPSVATIASAQRVYGFRLQKQFQALAQASALERKKNIVEKFDVERILNLMNWVNFAENPMISGFQDARDT